MSLRGRLFALAYDRLSAKSEQGGLRDLRRALLADARGQVLEIGAGTGANLALYGPDVESLTVTDPEPPMLRRLRRRAGEEAPRAAVVQAAAEDLPFEDGAFDTAVATLVLCGVGDQARALSELRRVLRPGGRLLFLEHVRSDDPRLARLQDRVNRLNRLVSGCDCNRATLAGIAGAGFEVERLERTTMPNAPPFVRPLVVGAAARGA